MHLQICLLYTYTRKEKYLKKKWLAMDGKKMFSNFKIYLKIQIATYMNLLYTV